MVFAFSLASDFISSTVFKVSKMAIAPLQNRIQEAFGGFIFVGLEP